MNFTENWELIAIDEINDSNAKGVTVLWTENESEIFDQYSVSDLLRLCPKYNNRMDYESIESLVDNEDIRNQYHDMHSSKSKLSPKAKDLVAQDPPEYSLAVPFLFDKNSEFIERPSQPPPEYSTQSTEYLE